MALLVVRPDRPRGGRHTRSGGTRGRRGRAGPAGRPRQRRGFEGSPPDDAPDGMVDLVADGASEGSSGDEEPNLSALRRAAAGGSGDPRSGTGTSGW